MTAHMYNKITVYENQHLKQYYLNVGGKILHNFPLEPDAIEVLFGQKSERMQLSPRIKNKALYRMLKSCFLSIDNNASAIAQFNNSFNATGKSKNNQFKEKAHGFGEMIHIAYEILETNMKNQIEGDIFEFGCFTGIGTAKLSLVSNFLNKKLYGFDSFQGLPDTEIYGEGEQKIIYAEKDYAGSINLVQKNIQIHGIPTNVKLVEGFFSETVQPFFEENKDQKIAACFIDADIAKSIDECLEYVIPRLSVGSLIIMHEANDIDNHNVFNKHNLFDTETYEIYSVCNRGDTYEYQSEADIKDLQGCGIFRKLK
jgi:hypothetical protein